MASTRTRIFYGWWIVAIAALGLFFSEPAVAVYSYSVFLKAVSQGFHVGRGPVALAFTFHNLCTAGFTPVVGYLIDRFGAKRIVIPATVLVGLVAILAKAIGPSLWQFYIFYAVLGMLGPAAGPLPYSAIVARWFDRHRGLALGLMSFGSSLAAIAYPPIAQRLITQGGWRSAYATLGVGILFAPILFLILFLKEDPRREGLVPDGDATAHANVLAGAKPAGLEWREIWRSGTFRLLITIFFLAGCSAHACVLHLAPLLGDRGFSPQAAANAVSIIGVAMLLGRSGSGYFLDRFFAPHVCVALFGQCTIGIAILAAGASGALAIVAAFMVGIAFGAEVEVIAFLVSRYFGLRSFGVAFGFGFSSFVLAGAIGTYIMGAGFDRTHSYTAPLLLVLVAMLAATLLFTRLGPYRFAAEHGPPATTVVATESLPA
jgi:MFS family permease